MMGLAGALALAGEGMRPAGLLFAFPAFVAGIAALAALVTVMPTSPVAARAARVDVAVEIVRQRFARGEIDAEEYARLVSGLTRTA